MMQAYTPRQELIDDAASRVRQGMAPHQALEAVSSECRAYDVGTLAYAMRAYYLSTTDSALERLIKAVERKARPC